MTINLNHFSTLNIMILCNLFNNKKYTSSESFSIWMQKPVSIDICRQIFWENNLDLSLIFNVFSYISNVIIRINLDSENFCNSFETLVTLISKCLDISRMLYVLNINLSVFDSSCGTPFSFAVKSNSSLSWAWPSSAPVCYLLVRADSKLVCVEL